MKWFPKSLGLVGRWITVCTVVLILALTAASLLLRGKANLLVSVTWCVALFFWLVLLKAHNMIDQAREGQARRDQLINERYQSCNTK